MSDELIVNSTDTGVVLALMRDKKLIELHEESGNNDFSVGDIYLGKVRKVVPNLNAAFVQVGYEKDAFLHYLDLGPQFRSFDKWVKGSINGKITTQDLANFKKENDLNKDGKIKDILSSNRVIAVQIAKEPISSKGPRLSTEITLPGRFVVLVPFSNKISISQKIKDEEERDRLRRLMNSIKPKNFGVIIRTVAQNKKVAELDQDLRNLVENWEKLHKGLRNGKPPKRILGEMNRTTTILRDLLTTDFSGITVNDAQLADEIREYVEQIEPGKGKIVKNYTGRIAIFDNHGINHQIKASFGRKVSMPTGSYLIVEHTEAMHVIDVNSGNRKGAVDQEANALATNLESATEIARILKLRDMGGIITVDFIDMHERKNNKLLHEHFRKAMKDDRAKHNILPPSRFGVIELTRQRVRPETDIKTAEVCPSCKGTGEVTATILVIDEIENNIRYLTQEKKMKEISLLVHPFVEAYIKKGLTSSLHRKWKKNYSKKITVEGSAKLPILQYEFVDLPDEITI
ncbi:MAG: ribonuclease G [Parvicellaceae bacterium]